MNVLDLDQLHQAIIDTLKAGFPNIQNVFDYSDQPLNRIPKPALSIQLTEMEILPDEDSGDEALPVNASFTLYVMFNNNEPNTERSIRKLSSDLALFIKGQRWGLTGIFPAQVERFGIDQFEPSIDRSLIWSVEFSQQLWIGKSVWNDEAFPARVANQLAKNNSQPIRAKPKDPANPNSEWEALTPPTHITTPGIES